MRVQLDNFGRYSALSENEDEDPGLHDDDGTPPPPPPPVSDGPPAPLDIWQTVFYGLAFTSAVGLTSTCPSPALQPWPSALSIFLVSFNTCFKYVFLPCPRHASPCEKLFPISGNFSTLLSCVWLRQMSLLALARSRTGH